MKKKLVICIAVIGGLLAARQLNTVPDRNWVGGTQSRPKEVHTVNSLIGSSYRGFVNGEYINVESKAFSDVLDSVNLCGRTPKEKLAHDREVQQENVKREKQEQEKQRLLSATKSPDPYVCREAHKALARLGYELMPD